jgi:ribosomal protein S18 acetylase RimI-like enzyme
VAGLRVTVREATEDDVPRILELWKEFMDFHAERDPWYTRGARGHECFAEFVRKNMAAEDALVLVADAGAAAGPIGYAMARVGERPAVFDDRRTAEVLDLAVTAPHRRKGAGERLLKAVLGWFRGRGLARIDVGAVVTNEAATSFWRKMGFRPHMSRLCMSVEPD